MGAGALSHGGRSGDRGQIRHRWGGRQADGRLAEQRATRPGIDRGPGDHGGPARRQSPDRSQDQPRRYSSSSRPAGTSAIRVSHRPGAPHVIRPGSPGRRDHGPGSSNHASGCFEKSPMTDFSPQVVVPLLIWGTLVGLDLVSVPQAMISRPLVAGTVAGWILGDFEAGLRMGVLFELFALDVLPVGAVRYPDYGPATIAAVAVAAGAPNWGLVLGMSAALGLVLAVLGGWSLQIVRRWNARAIQRSSAALA